ncbi:protein-glutamate O-methyltransferase CheR [bacterium]|nr:protein-glutamate O-methyltransferase CheR [bacterium]MBU1884065.1 protein-glutamate O-methyltransferase CheR [bacterium]
MFSFFKKNKKDVQTTNKPAVVEIEDYSDVAPIGKYIKEQTGINFDRQQGILKSKMTSFCKIRDIRSFQTCLRRVLAESELKQDLINYITTNETYFYRELRQIHDFVDHVKQEHKKVDILCAPCASGEEPYSLAIALLEANVSYHEFTITAIDISTEALELAKRAIYKERNVKNLSDDLKSKYFDFKENNYVLKEQIKNLVTFAQINVFEKEFQELGKFDYVFSRNMLIYFDKETKLKAKEILESMLKDKEKAVYFGHADLY